MVTSYDKDILNCTFPYVSSIPTCTVFSTSSGTRVQKQMNSCWHVRHAAALQAVMYNTGQRLSPLTTLLPVLHCAATKYMYSLDLITIPDCTTYSRHGQVLRAAEETITFWRAEAVQMKLSNSTCKAGVDIGHTRVNLQLKTSAANQIIYHQLHSFHLRTADSILMCAVLSC